MRALTVTPHVAYADQASALLPQQCWEGAMPYSHGLIKSLFVFAGLASCIRSDFSERDDSGVNDMRVVEPDTGAGDLGQVLTDSSSQRDSMQGASDLTMPDAALSDLSPTPDMTVVPSCTDSVKNDSESDVDCGGTCPMKCANGQRCNSVADCGVHSLCNGGNFCVSIGCADGIKDGDETDTDCGGSTCSTCLIGGTCLHPGDCLSTHCVSMVCRECGTYSDCPMHGACVANTCRAPTCVDGITNGNESDIDCGGSCGKCGNGQGCGNVADCVSGICSAGICQIMTCSDGMLDGDETDVDCGGSCAKCVNNKNCSVAADCASGICTGHVCHAPSCSDSIKNQNETDIDCGGLCSQCALGKTCLVNPDCTTGYCSGGVCVRKLTFTSTRLQPGINPPQMVKIADVNNDGKGDLCVLVGGSVSVGLGNGDGTFQTFRSFGNQGFTTQSSLVIADLDKDGNADVIVAGNYVSNFGNVAVLLGRGDGTLQTNVTYDTPDTDTITGNVATGDFNGDHRADVAVLVNGSATIFLGNGDGTLQSAKRSVLTGNDTALAIADFNGDAFDDLAVVTDTAISGTSYPRMGVMIGRGDGTFNSVALYNAPTNLETVVTGDFNGDGKSDIAVGSAVTQDQVNLYYGNGDGTFQTSVIFSLPANSLSRAAAVGDFDSDGKPDYAAAGSFTNNVAVLLAGGPGLQLPQLFTSDIRPISIAVGDLNGDNKPDIVTASTLVVDLQILLNTTL